jgi:hypothetical protein
VKKRRIAENAILLFSLYWAIPALTAMITENKILMIAVIIFDYFLEE